MPMIVTNHTYDVIGAYVPTKEMGGEVVSSMPHQQLSISVKRKKRMELISSEILSRQRLLSHV